MQMPVDDNPPSDLPQRYEIAFWSAQKLRNHA